MLKAEEYGQENGNTVVESVKWRLIVLVLPVQRPHVGGDQVDVVLGLSAIYSR
jgi:hypothetical protein